MQPEVLFALLKGLESPEMAPVGEKWALSETHATSASLTFFDKITGGSKGAFWIKGPMNAEQGPRRTNM